MVILRNPVSYYTKYTTARTAKRDIKKALNKKREEVDQITKVFNKARRAHLDALSLLASLSEKAENEESDVTAEDVTEYALVVTDLAETKASIEIPLKEKIEEFKDMVPINKQLKLEALEAKVANLQDMYVGAYSTHRRSAGLCDGLRMQLDVKSSPIKRAELDAYDELVADLAGRMAKAEARLTKNKKKLEELRWKYGGVKEKED